MRGVKGASLGQVWEDIDGNVNPDGGDDGDGDSITTTLWCCTGIILKLPRVGGTRILKRARASSAARRVATNMAR